MLKLGSPKFPTPVIFQFLLDYSYYCEEHLKHSSSQEKKEKIEHHCSPDSVFLKKFKENEGVQALEMAVFSIEVSNLIGFHNRK